MSEAQPNSGKASYLIGEPLTDDVTADEIGDRPTSILGQPVVYRRARCMKIGTPYRAFNEKTGKRESLVVKADEAPKLIANFNQAKENGVESPVVADHKRTASNARGFVVSTAIKDGWLEAILQLIGDDAAREAARNRVSPGIRPDFTDGQGRKYPGLFLEHVALTPIPVASSQGPLLAASRGAEGEEPDMVFTLSAASDQESPMKAELKAQAIKQLSEAGESIDDTAGDDDVMSRLIAHHKDRGDDILTLKKHADDLHDYCRNLSMEEGEVASLREKLADAEAKVLTMSRTDEPDPEVLGGYAELTLGRIDLALQRGDMPSAIANKIKAAVIDAEKRPSAFMLSRAEEIGTRPIDFVLSLFNRAKLAPGTSGDALIMSRDDHPANVDVNKPESGGAVPAEKIEDDKLAEARRALGYKVA